MLKEKTYTATGFKSGIEMRSKTLIIQIDIGRGTQWGTINTINPPKFLFHL